MRRALLLLPFFIMTPVNAAEITSRITDSVQLTVDGPMVQSTRVGSNYSVSGTNINVTTLGGMSIGSATAPPSLTDGSYAINTNGQAFTFSESSMVGDVAVTTQSSLSSGGRIETPNIYGTSSQYQGGTPGSLAGTLSATGIPTVTAGGSGTTAIGQRTVELSVFQ
jgi:hypothetical protein